jgi:hypothetical protein
MKTFVSVLAAFGLAGVLAACAGGGEGSDNSGSNVSGSSSSSSHSSSGSSGSSGGKSSSGSGSGGSSSGLNDPGTGDDDASVTGDDASTPTGDDASTPTGDDASTPTAGDAGGGPTGNGPCGFFNCKGCCNVFGMCVDGTDPGNCGSSGNKCFSCPSSLMCYSGICLDQSSINIHFDAGSCANVSCLTVLDCNAHSTCGFTKCDGFVCK